MTISRRSFLAGILSSGFAPAIVGSGVLMPVRALARVPFPLNGVWKPTDEGVLRVDRRALAKGAKLYLSTTISLVGPSQTKILLPIGRFGERGRWVDITEANLEHLIKETLK